MSMQNDYYGFYNNGNAQMQVGGRPANMEFSNPPPSTQGSMPNFQNNVSFPTTRQSVIPGSFIQSIDQITVGDVPNDGSVGTFVMADYSAVILRKWNNKGSIDEEIYVPMKREQQTQDAGNGITVDFTPLYERLDKLEKEIKRNNYRKPQDGGNE